MRTLAAIVTIAVVLGALPVAARTAQGRDVRYADDRLSIDVENMPLREVLATIAEASGAKLVGEPQDGERAITLVIESSPAEDALRRLLGAQPFALRYKKDGTLKSIVLVAPSNEPAAPTVAARPPAPAPTPVPVALGRPLAVDGALAASLDAKEAPFAQVMDLAMRSDDKAVRWQAAQVTVEALDGDADLREAFLKTYGNLNPQLAAGTIQHDPNGQEFVRFLAENARTDELRRRAAAVIGALSERE